MTNSLNCYTVIQGGAFLIADVHLRIEPIKAAPGRAHPGRECAALLAKDVCLAFAVGTSRSYVKSLYGKLDAHDWGEAIEKGHPYGLI